MRHCATRSKTPTTAQRLHALRAHQQSLLPPSQPAVPQLPTNAPCRAKPQIPCDHMRHDIPPFKPGMHGMRMRAEMCKRKHDVGSHNHNSRGCSLDGVDRDPRQNTGQQARSQVPTTSLQLTYDGLTNVTSDHDMFLRPPGL